MTRYADTPWRAGKSQAVERQVMTRFILRCDDCGQALDQSKPDIGLEYFWRWWNAGGWGDEPIYLGVVPGVLGERELDMLLDLESRTEAVVSIHGWMHDQRILMPEDLVQAKARFPKSNTCIPPYNQYDERTIEGMREWDMPVLFGGFDGEHHNYGEAPKVIGNVLHLSARRDLYARCYQLVDVVDKVEDMGYPLQMTLHLRWDSGTMNGVGPLRKALSGKMTTTDECWPE